MRLVFLGPPGAGKGTQALKLAEHFGVPHIATGDMYRREVELDTELGRMAAEIMARGDLMPDEITREILARRIADEDAQKGFVLDGYPRNLVQAEDLDQLLEEMGARLDAAIKFMVTGDVIVERLAGRWSCPVCNEIYHLVTRPPKVPGKCDNDGVVLEQRADDSEEAIRHRLDVYGQETKPLYDRYAGMGLLREVDAIGTQEEVFRRLIEAVDSK
jgi:adenylate kinase